MKFLPLFFNYRKPKEQLSTLKQKIKNEEISSLF